MRRGVGRTQNFTYLGVLLHASLVAVGAPHYLMKESLANCTRIMVATECGPSGSPKRTLWGRKLPGGISPHSAAGLLLGAPPQM